MQHELNLLITGEFICAVTYPGEFEALRDAEFSASVDAWLGKLGKSLGRLGDDGEEIAFFMVDVDFGTSHSQTVRDSLLRLRDVYGPCIRMIDMIRHGSEDFSMQPGEVIELAALEQAINRSSTLEALLRNLQSSIREASARLSNREVLKKLLEHLSREGYLLLVNSDTDLYKVTGKIMHLIHVLQVVEEHQPLQMSSDSDDASGEESDAEGSTKARRPFKEEDQSDLFGSGEKDNEQDDSDKAGGN